MKLEDQVVSLELSKRLRDLGVKQESTFIWLNTNHGTECVLEPDIDRWYDGQWKNGWSVDCSAFTVAELGEMLPARHIDTMKIEGEWFARYVEVEHNFYQSEFSATEADARAKLLIFLIEKKLITL